MIFASGLFLFLFFPITLLGSFCLRNRPIYAKNTFLLFMSLLFYLNCGVRQTLLLISSILVNYIIAVFIVQYESVKSRILFMGIIYNIGMLFVFKYLSFLSEQITNHTSLNIVVSIALPLGISFYTFQALSYIIDVYRDKAQLETNIINVALYISFFPQLVAGPIVRWQTIKDNMTYRKADINYGIERFVIGLSKKVIIANNMSIFADKAFGLLKRNDLTSAMAWLGAIAYTLQIYYDFSGYSDMAIGLGRIFGFEFPENFNYPYTSRSITEFWRRWHISLSQWFRDYVYIPLGGNRKGNNRTTINLFIVWLLTGVWHGANYTFWMWGIAYFFLLIIEKKFSNKEGKQNICFKAIGHLYTMLSVIVLWVIFRADTMTEALNYIRVMFIGGNNNMYSEGVTQLYLSNSIVYLVIAIIGCTPVVKNTKERIVKYRYSNLISQLETIFLFIVAVCVTIDCSYNPFIYFNF